MSRYRVVIARPYKRVWQTLKLLILLPPSRSTPSSYTPVSPYQHLSTSSTPSNTRQVTMPRVSRNRPKRKAAALSAVSKQLKSAARREKAEREATIFNELWEKAQGLFDDAAQKLGIPATLVLQHLALQTPDLLKNTAVNSWNGFLSLKLEEYNEVVEQENTATRIEWELKCVANPDLAESPPATIPKWKAADVAQFVRSEYFALSQEERDELVKFLGDKRANTGAKMRKYGMMAARDNTRTTNAIQRLMELQHAKTGMKFVAWGVKSDASQSTTPWSFSSPGMGLASQAVFKRNMADVGVGFETYAVSKALSMLPYDDDDDDKNINVDLTSTVTEHSSRNRQKARISKELLTMHNDVCKPRSRAERLNYVNFWTDHVVKRRVTIEGWPLKYLKSPSLFNKPELKMVVKALSEKKISFRRLNDDEFKELSDQKAHDEVAGVSHHIYNHQGRKAPGKSAQVIDVVAEALKENEMQECLGRLSLTSGTTVKEAGLDAPTLPATQASSSLPFGEGWDYNTNAMDVNMSDFTGPILPHIPIPEFVQGSSGDTTLPPQLNTPAVSNLFEDPELGNLIFPTGFEAGGDFGMGDMTTGRYPVDNLTMFMPF